MPAIGEWVIDEACRAVATWPDPITVALNISPKQIVMAALPNIVSEALGNAGDEVSGGRCDDNEIGLLPQPYMCERPARLPQRSLDRATGQRLECDGPDERAGTLRHNDIYLRTRLS